MLFSYGYGQQHNRRYKNEGETLGISIAMRMRRYDTGHIAC